MPVIFILLILFLRKGNYMYDCNFISLFFTPVTKTDIPTSEYSSTYLYTNFEHFMRA